MPRDAKEKIKNLRHSGSSESCCQAECGHDERDREGEKTGVGGRGREGRGREEERRERQRQGEKLERKEEEGGY